ncbi:MAG: nitronate monooxygenase [Solirubrobacteraceae bacterium]|jgi:nitronate monooxygenase|nr:nitronate monooxygenase [Solirubrobacteraceae bacterium]
MILDAIEIPIVLAPLAGGPATIDLAVAVSAAGGLGFLAAGYRTAADVREQVQAFRARSDRPFGVNLFTPQATATPAAVYAAYVERLQPEAVRAGVRLGEPRFDDDDWEGKLAALYELAVPVVSFVFGCPQADVIAALRARGSSVWVTVTSPAEARRAEDAGVDALVVQGYEAGGHRGSFSDGEQPAFGLLALLQLVGERAGVPLIAAGGIATGRGVAAALAGGARAAQVGTAFLRCPEAGTSAAHRAALATAAPTAITRAFTGKPARGIVNRFMRDHGDDAPLAYPELHHVTAPLRRAARESGDPDVINLWAGQTHELGTDESAAVVARRLADEARTALRRADGLWGAASD